MKNKKKEEKVTKPCTEKRCGKRSHKRAKLREGRSEILV